MRGARGVVSAMTLAACGRQHGRQAARAADTDAFQRGAELPQLLVPATCVCVRERRILATRLGA